MLFEAKYPFNGVQWKSEMHHRRAILSAQEILGCCAGLMLIYVGVVELLRDLPLYGGRFDSPLIRDLESRRDVLTGQSTLYYLYSSNVNLRE